MEPNPDHLTVTIGFCAERNLQSAVHGSIARVSSPADPAFRSLIARMMQDLIPRSDEDRPRP